MKSDFGHQRALLRKALRDISGHATKIQKAEQDIKESWKGIETIITKALQETEKLPSAPVHPMACGFRVIIDETVPANELRLQNGNKVLSTVLAMKPEAE